MVNRPEALKPLPGNLSGSYGKSAKKLLLKVRGLFGGSKIQEMKSGRI